MSEIVFNRRMHGATGPLAAADPGAPRLKSSPTLYCVVFAQARVERLDLCNRISFKPFAEGGVDRENRGSVPNEIYYTSKNCKRGFDS